MNKAGMEVGMRVVFMGTPDFAVATLEDIINAGHIVEAVVTVSYTHLTLPTNSLV